MGELDGSGLIETGQENLDKGIKQLAIDLSKLRYMNSSGIGVLITLLTKFRNAGGDVVLIKPSSHIEKLLLITKLNSIFEVFQEVQNASDYLKTQKS